MIVRTLIVWSFGHLFSVLGFVLVLVWVSYILRSKRPPGNTLAWLFFAALAPYVGIPLFIFLTDRKFGTRVQKKKLLYKPAPERVPGVQGEVEKILSGYGVTPPRSNQEVRFMASGEQAYEKIAKSIESARRDIRMTTFIFSNDAVAQSLVSLLEKKAEEGVSVRVLVDSFGSIMTRAPSFKALKRKGGQVAYFNSFFHMPIQGRANFRNHRKLLVIDSERAILGGMNVAAEYMGPAPDPRRWIDFCFEVSGTSVQDMEAIFEEDWRFSTGREALIEAPPAPEAGGDANLQVIASGPDVSGDTLYDALMSIIFKASRRIWIATPYFIPDDSLTKALDLAARRGIDVRIMVPGRSNHLLADLARGSYLRELANSGCAVSMAPKMMHAKAVLVDDRFALLGSANFDMRSLLLNFEIGVLLRSGAAINDLEGWFEGNLRRSRRADFKPNYWRELAEGVGRVLGPLI